MCSHVLTHFPTPILPLPKSLSHVFTHLSEASGPARGQTPSGTGAQQTLRDRRSGAFSTEIGPQQAQAADDGSLVGKLLRLPRKGTTWILIKRWESHSKVQFTNMFVQVSDTFWLYLRYRCFMMFLFHNQNEIRHKKVAMFSFTAWNMPVACYTI